MVEKNMSRFWGKKGWAPSAGFLKCSFFFCCFVGCTARTSILLHPADNGGYELRWETTMLDLELEFEPA